LVAADHLMRGSVPAIVEPDVADALILELTPEHPHGAKAGCRGITELLPLSCTGRIAGQPLIRDGRTDAIARRTTDITEHRAVTSVGRDLIASRTAMIKRNLRRPWQPHPGKSHDTGSCRLRKA
jgi:hypothetical protein